MERPALQQLLIDIHRGLVDVVVVYKVDRLTRSLADFAKMVEVFDARGASFVAVTQQFNTTTSMGRLTLNVLLSFAQFEREVTGERIRDKIAASKHKGMWMGGVVALGYDVRERRLVVNQDEAATVRHIFQRYLELGSVRLLKDDLDRSGMVSKIRVSKMGAQSGGCAFSRGALYELLSNPIYIGEIRHKNDRHPGQHEPIVGRELWEKAQQKLREQAAHPRGLSTKPVPSPLAGKLFDESGEPLYVCGAIKHQRRYRYYVSRRLIRSSAHEVQDGWRLAALEIERSVVMAIAQILKDHAGINAVLNDAGVSSADLASAFKAIGILRGQIESGREIEPGVLSAIERVDLRRDGFNLAINLAPLISQKADVPDGARHDHEVCSAVAQTARRRIANRAGGRSNLDREDRSDAHQSYCARASMVHGAGFKRCGGYTQDCKARRSERQLCQALDSARVARAGDRRSDLCRFPTSRSHCRRADASRRITHHLGQPAAGAGHRFGQPFQLDLFATKAVETIQRFR
jgi:site-specific DNA recombinase